MNNAFTRKQESILPTPYSKRTVSLRPDDENQNRMNDPSSWNLEDGPVDQPLLSLLAAAIDNVMKVNERPDVYIFPTWAIIENACMEGGGIELTRESIWKYRSVNARATMGYMEQYWIYMPSHGAQYRQVPYSDYVRDTFLYSYMIAYGPIVLQQALLRTRQSHKMNAIDTSEDAHVELLVREISNILVIAIDSLDGAMGLVANGTNIFTLDHNWDKPSEQLPQSNYNPKNQLRRSDPLEFPNAIPPPLRTHFHGRWAQFQGNRRMVWVEYPPCSLQEMFDVPPNLSFRPEHWVGRTMPGANKAFVSVDQAMKLIHMYRNALGIATNDAWEAGPPIRQDHRKDGDNTDTIPTLPPDGAKRSPFCLQGYSYLQVPDYDWATKNTQPIISPHASTPQVPPAGLSNPSVSDPQSLSNMLDQADDRSKLIAENSASTNFPIGIDEQSQSYSQ